MILPKRKKIINQGAEYVIINYDGVEIVADEIANGGFDLIIADPPYNIDSYSYLSDNLRSILNPDGILCIEMKKKEINDESVRIRTFGSTQLTFWRNK